MELQDRVKREHPHLHGFIELAAVIVGLMFLAWMMI